MSIPECSHTKHLAKYSSPVSGGLVLWSALPASFLASVLLVPFFGKAFTVDDRYLGRRPTSVGPSSELGNVAALFIDPITAYFGKVESHKNVDVGALLTPLTYLAAKRNTAIIGISQLTKASGSQGLMPFRSIHLKNLYAE